MMAIIRPILLIQDVKEFVHLLKPTLDPIIKPYVDSRKLTEKEMLEWIISKEIEKIHLISNISFLRNRDPFTIIYHSLLVDLSFDLSRFISKHIVVPYLVGDNNQVIITLKNYDLSIEYRRDLSQFSHLTFS
jgi:hypothetical protein